MFAWTFTTPPPSRDEAAALVLMAARWSPDQKEAFACVVAVALGLAPEWRPETRELATAAMSLAAPDIDVVRFGDDPHVGFWLTEHGLRLVAAVAIPAILRRGSSNR